MIPTTAFPRPVRVAVAAASVVGVVVLAGCATEAAPAAETSTPTATATPQATETAAAEAPDSTYVDGTYTADGSYATPETVEKITVTVTLQDDVVTGVDVVGNPTKRESVQYQGEFIGGIDGVVVGKRIDELAVSRVAGSSLTSGGFNQALETIKAEAKA